MPTRELLSPAQRAQFLSLPAEMNEQILARYYTLSPEDLARIRRDHRELSTWLMPLALSTDAGPALVGALIEEMRDRQIIIPGITTVERLGWEVRRRAEQQVFRLLTEGLTDLQRAQLQALLTVPAASRQTLLVWLRQPPGAVSPANFLKGVERLRWIRELGL